MGWSRREDTRRPRREPESSPSQVVEIRRGTQAVEKNKGLTALIALDGFAGLLPLDESLPASVALRLGGMLSRGHVQLEKCRVLNCRRARIVWA